MADFKLLNYAALTGEPKPAILIGDAQILDLETATSGASWAKTNIDIMNNWGTACSELHELADTSENTNPLSDVKLLAPLLYPPAIYCAGAN